MRSGSTFTPAPCFVQTRGPIYVSSIALFFGIAVTAATWFALVRLTAERRAVLAFYAALPRDAAQREAQRLQRRGDEDDDDATDNDGGDGGGAGAGRDKPAPGTAAEGGAYWSTPHSHTSFAAFSLSPFAPVSSSASLSPSLLSIFDV